MLIKIYICGIMILSFFQAIIYIILLLDYWHMLTKYAPLETLSYFGVIPGIIYMHLYTQVIMLSIHIFLLVIWTFMQNRIFTIIEIILIYTNMVTILHDKIYYEKYVTITYISVIVISMLILSLMVSELTKR